MNGFTLMAFRLLAMACLLAFVLWQFQRNAVELGFSVGSLATWVIGGLCLFGVGASIAGVFDESRLSRSNAVALVLNGLGALLTFLQT